MPDLITAKHIALVNQSENISDSEFSTVAAALQKQATVDIGPIWNISATVDAFNSYDDIPPGYFPVVIKDSIERPDSNGFHHTDNNEPFALIRYSPTWSLSASHEICEMLIDPSGSNLIKSPSLNPGAGDAHYLVEVCDPCESAKYGYYVNNILVSDFYTPGYFDPAKSATGIYSCRQNITEPRQVLPGGYLTWQDSDKTWWQKMISESGTENIRQLNGMENALGCLRSRVDQLTYIAELKEGVKNKKLKSAILKQHSIGRNAAKKNGAYWLKQINKKLKK